MLLGSQATKNPRNLVRSVHGLSSLQNTTQKHYKNLPLYTSTVVCDKNRISAAQGLSQTNLVTTKHKTFINIITKCSNVTTIIHNTILLVVVLLHMYNGRCIVSLYTIQWNIHVPLYTIQWNIHVPLYTIQMQNDMNVN